MRQLKIDHTGRRTADYLLGALTAEQDHHFEAHLLRCRPCLTEADALSEVAVAITQIPIGAVGYRRP